MSTRPADLGEADKALKAKHRTKWALGNYDAVATEVIADLGPILVEATGVRPGDRVLDVAAGSGNVAPPPPPGASPPPLWGSEDHVRALLGDRVDQVTAETRALPVAHFDRPEAFRDYFKANYGPTIAAYRFNAEDPEKVAALDQGLADLGRRFDRGEGSTVLDWEYLLLTARRAR